MDSADDDRPLVVVVEHRVHVPGHVAERLPQRDGIRIPGAEDQPAVRLHVRHLDKTPLPRLEGLWVAVLVGHADQRTVQVVRPAVVGAGEVAGGAEVGAADAGTPVPQELR